VAYTFRFVVKPSVDSATILLDTTSVSVVGIFDDDRDANTQRARISLSDTDLAASVFRPGTYQHSLKRTDDGSERIIIAGPFEIEKATQV